MNHNLQQEKFLNYFQIWSNEFQKMVLARVVFSEDPEFRELAWHHLQEEFGHNLDLLRNRKKYIELNDPILEAISGWFTSKMLTLGDAEITVLVHLVVESCATIFYEILNPFFYNNNESMDHFNTHLHLDHSHEQIGIDLLVRTNSFSQSLINIQKKGWIMIETLFTRLAEVCTE